MRFFFFPPEMPNSEYKEESFFRRFESYNAFKFSKPLMFFNSPAKIYEVVKLINVLVETFLVGKYQTSNLLDLGCKDLATSLIRL